MQRVALRLSVQSRRISISGHVEDADYEVSSLEVKKEDLKALYY